MDWSGRIDCFLQETAGRGEVPQRVVSDELWNRRKHAVLEAIPSVATDVIIIGLVEGHAFKRKG